MSVLRVGLLCLLVGLPLLAAAEERILDYRSDIQVAPDGRLTVTETLRVKAEGNQIRRGIYREFPTRYRDRFGNHYRVDFDVLSVRRDGQPEAWHTKDMSNGVRTYFGRADHLLDPGVYEYEFIFTTNRQLGFFDEHDELWWNVTGNGWIFPIDHVAATVTLPFEADPDQFGLNIYLGHYGSTETGSNARVVDSNTVIFESSRPLNSWEGMSIIVSWPKGLMAEPGLTKKIRWFLSDNAAALVLLIGLLLTFGWYHWAWGKVGRDPRKGVIIPRFEPPAGLSPAASRFVLDMGFNRNAFTAAIISLAVKGQLTIEEDGKDYTLRRNEDEAKASLTKGEQAVLRALLPYRGATLELDDKNHQKFQAARAALKSELRKEYLGRLFHLNRIYLVPPWLISLAAAGIAFFLDGGPAVWVVYLVLTLGLHGLFSFLMRAPTPDGRQVMDEIEGFRMYLDTAERERLDLMRSPALTPELFETFLPYAYALGVENNWCKRFASELPQEVGKQSGYHPGWYSGKHRGMSALNHIGSSFGRSFSSAISSASSPPGSSSGGGGGGGGSSGGGGGGGGGGGW
jgi:uncharacterized protein (TIGR04222 family)